MSLRKKIFNTYTSRIVQSKAVLFSGSKHSSRLELEWYPAIYQAIWLVWDFEEDYRCVQVSTRAAIQTRQMNTAKTEIGQLVDGLQTEECDRWEDRVQN